MEMAFKVLNTLLVKILLLNSYKKKNDLYTGVCFEAIR